MWYNTRLEITLQKFWKYVHKILKLPCKCAHEILKLPCRAKLIALQSLAIAKICHNCHTSLTVCLAGGHPWNGFTTKALQPRLYNQGFQGWFQSCSRLTTLLDTPCHTSLTGTNIEPLHQVRALATDEPSSRDWEPVNSRLLAGKNLRCWKLSKAR
jgi:hypothetical protein